MFMQTFLFPKFERDKKNFRKFEEMHLPLSYVDPLVQEMLILIETT